MELYLGETCRIVPYFLEYKKRQLELWKDVGIEFCVEMYLKKFAFDITIYIMFIRKSQFRHKTKK